MKMVTKFTIGFYTDDNDMFVLVLLMKVSFARWRALQNRWM